MNNTVYTSGHVMEADRLMHGQSPVKAVDMESAD